MYQGFGPNTLLTLLYMHVNTFKCRISESSYVCFTAPTIFGNNDENPGFGILSQSHFDFKPSEILTVLHFKECKYSIASIAIA